jgi:aryl-alcohol dehydrogenase-like predicted oxidoreductase
MTNKPTQLISLGTANFGIVYGLGSYGKKLEISQVAQILCTANEKGFSHIDTASSYANSERILGDFIPESAGWHVTTKLKSIDCVDAKSMVQAVKTSLSQTKQKRFWSVLLHDSKALFGGNSHEVRRGLEHIVELELAQHAGISAYSEYEIVKAKSVAPFLKVFQISENVCDRRLARSSNLSRLASEGNYFFVRSIFLQGLLLMDPNELPDRVVSASPGLHKLRMFCEKLNVSVLELCIGYAKSLNWSSGLIFGINSEKQVLAISDALNSSIEVDYSKVPKLPQWILDPRNWS